MASIGERILDIFGQGNNRKFYMRDFKNATRFQPGVDPVRHKFQGYVNFILNRDLFASLYGNPTGENEFRTTISSLVRSAQMPGVSFKTEVMNEYNRKKIVNTGVEYEPVNMTVYDTVGNEWLILLMKYFSYHYMNPRNKNSSDSRDVAGSVSREGGAEEINSFFGREGIFDSNAAGYNPNRTPNFFERIDYVLYHGNRGVQYSLINPVLTNFRASDIDYSDSGFKDFELGFQYESFTVYDKVNFGLTDEDVDRFENAEGFTGPAFEQANLPIAMNVFDDSGQNLTVDGLKLGVLGNSDSKRHRSGQPVVQGPAPAVNPRNPGSVYGAEAVFAPGTGGSEERSFLEDLLLDTADEAIRAAINQRDVGDAVLGTVLGATGTFIGEAINSSINDSSPNQGGDQDGGG